jgi:hypothetical protein
MKVYFKKDYIFFKPGYTDALNVTVPSAKIGYIILRNARNNLILKRLDSRLFKLKQPSKWRLKMPDDKKEV